MSTFFIIASAVLAVLTGVVIVALARRTTGAAHLARIVLPISVLALLAQMALQHWSVAGFALLGSVIISAGALAVRGRGRDHAPTWAAVAVFAAAGLTGGFGLLAHGRCNAGSAYNCPGSGADPLATSGWAAACGAYASLAVGALRR